jgi:lipid-binding SYLF domain-containing protein
MIQADSALERFRNHDPSIDQRIAEAHGYAVFPSIAKGGAGVGGAFGRGIVYELGEPVGFATATQASFGLQLGGQAYSELILFDRVAFDRFRRGQFSLDAQASAVAVTAGAAANAEFRNGVMVFVLGQKGLMYEAAIAGQKFGFEPM